ncbi:MAG: hypothetical protein IK076_02905 [Bacteroidales bacterium]|nr:hypothetical protein [Bacteroidales bacterium]
MSQPDGTSFLARLWGDEYAKVLMTADGCAVMRCDDGFYRYAYYNPDGTRESSGYKVGGDTPSLILDSCRNIPWKTLRAKAAMDRSGRTRAERQRPRTRASSPVRRNCIIILAQFSDISFMNGSSRRQEFIDLVISGV